MKTPWSRKETKQHTVKGYVELGTIQYLNLTSCHWYSRTKKEANICKFCWVVWLTGVCYDTLPCFSSVFWSLFLFWYTHLMLLSFYIFKIPIYRCKDAGLIFADPIVKRAAEELFVPCAFNTWDRHNPRLNQPMRRWGAGLANSWWGYLRIIDPEGKLVIGGTKQITSHRCIEEVKQCMRDALEDLGEEIPAWFE